MQHMKKVLKNMACMAGAMALLAAAGCKDSDKGTPPAGLSGLEAAGLPGEILLTWNLPSQDDNIHQIKVTYYDPLIKKDVMRVASAYAESMVIPDTRARYGEYTFTVWPCSRDADGAAQVVSAVSDSAKGYWIMSNRDSMQLPRTAADLYTNAQEPTEGPIENLLDNNRETFFHTTWGSGKWSADTSFLGNKHYLQIDLGQVLSADDSYYFNFYYAPRNNANNKPVDFDLYGSLVKESDKNHWFLIKNFTKENDNLPDDASTDYNSQVFPVTSSMQYIRLSVNKTNNDAKANEAVFWTMSEFRLWVYKAVQVWYDPEKDEVEL
jgi:hypothetical protein